MADDRPFADPPPAATTAPRTARPGRAPDAPPAVLAALASLRITVTLLGLSLFLVLAGTLAQVNRDIWDVVHGYFRCWFAYVPLRDLLPQTWFGPGTPMNWDVDSIRGGFWFPGGWTLGLGLAINQVASMLTKFKVKASGTTLWAGLAVTAMGAAITWAVVVSGMSGGATQDVPLLGFAAMWNLFRVCVAAAGIGMSVWTLRLLADPVRRREPATILIAAGAVGGLALALWALFQGAVSDGSARILWNLMKATFAAGVLLAGLLPIFGRQGGTFLLHCGLLMLLGSEFYTGVVARQPTQEASIFLREGDRADYLTDARSFELALITETPEGNRHAVVSGDELLAALKEERTIDDPRLPLAVTPVELFENARSGRPADEDALSALDDAPGGDPGYTLVEVAKGVGVGETASAQDRPGGLFRLTGKDGEVLGETLLWTDNVSLRNLLDPIPVVVETEDGPVRLQLRYTRKYLPYTVGLRAVRAEMYPGTTTPRTYESDLEITPIPGRADDDAGEPFAAFIKMNNPLRYSGRTFYQQNFYGAWPGGPAWQGGPISPPQPEGTGLQVVTNDGWMVPYVACMVLAVGMLAQFCMSLVRFLGRRGPVTVPEAAAANRDEPTPDPADEPGTGRWGWVFPAVVVLVLGGYAMSKWRAPEPYVTADKAATAGVGFDLDAFGKIPVLHNGRVKPIDTVARNALKAINGNKQTFDTATKATPAQIADGADPDQPVLTKSPALRWFLDLIADPPAMANHRVFRITNPQVLSTFGLKPREGLTYAIGEFPDDFSATLGQRIDDIRGPEGQGEPKTADDRAFVQLAQQLGVVNSLLISFDPEASVPPGASLAVYAQRYARLWDDGQAPLAVPRGPRWETLAHADLQESTEAGMMPVLNQAGVSPERFVNRLEPGSEPIPGLSATLTPSEFDGEVDPVVEAWRDLRTAWKDDEPRAFNLAVKRVRQRVVEADEERRAEFDVARSDPPLATGAVSFEAWFNHAAPLWWCWLLYLVATVFTLVGWVLVPVGWGVPPRRAAFWLILFTFAVHTVALAGRIYISGRPPVTNLYSSAVFIGWGAVGLGMLIERLYGWGVGNALACVGGVGTLLIAHSEPLSKGDTFTVLQAVLDTQFWLATHVVTITLGYAATGVAGILGLFYVLGGLCSPALATVVGRPGTRSAGQDLGRALAGMIYGVVCFAALLSLVGTILGGLWADDSWGRFWGWDPKENGALIIVIWNALVLHARWGKLVGERGLAVLAIAGNLAVAWSWFGTNELGVGLHSYGFTEGVLMTLLWVAVVHLAIIAAGAAIPRTLWWSENARKIRDARRV
ncbi:cytochrome c biogenesis protein [Alienimonas californiensis]|uniref:Cytochrome c biogenesis protein CcsA n=1 Tax=Alienimonas californiensis TaxID=2527989 RepID=A0A517P9H4_9PLAN|nr:cytochrome c biogenesis protein CcsA [Alienimonas californiensis]QDT16005.1 Cytochrome c biogenesis protein CcsA [Alienimonas californiensis]